MWSLVTICGALLMLQLILVQYRLDSINFTIQTFNGIQFHCSIQLHHNDNLVVLSITLFEVFYSFIAVLIPCELSQRLNLGFDEFNDMIVQFEWYLFPGKIQRMLPIVMNFTQQPVEITCFGSITANRDAFKYVSPIYQNTHECLTLYTCYKIELILQPKFFR